MFGRGDCHTSYDHSQALLRILISSTDQTTIEGTAKPPLLLKLAFEVAVLGTSTMALFQRRALSCMSLEDWQCLDRLHRRYYEGEQEVISFTSPLLQGHAALFILLLRLVHVSRMQPSAMREEHLSSIENQLSTIEGEQKTTSPVCPNSHPTLHSWSTMWQYVTIVLRIYLTSLQQPDLCSDSPQISTLATTGLLKARMIWSLTDKGTFTWPSPFAASKTGASRNIAGCTIAFILACAVNDPQALGEIQVRLRHAEGCLSASHFGNLARMLEILLLRSQDGEDGQGRKGSCTADSVGSCRGRHDGLDLLRLPRGPFEILCLDSVVLGD